MVNLLGNPIKTFATVVISTFMVGGILAVNGTFDHLGSRYELKRRRRNLLREKADREKININDSYNYKYALV